MILEQMIFKKLLVYKLPASFNPNHILLIQVDEDSVASHYPALFQILSHLHSLSWLLSFIPIDVFSAPPRPPYISLISINTLWPSAQNFYSFLSGFEFQTCNYHHNIKQISEEYLYEFSSRRSFQTLGLLQLKMQMCLITNKAPGWKWCLKVM